MGNATALTLSAILVLKKEKMLRLLHKEPELADRFITHMLDTNIRIAKMTGTSRSNVIGVLKRFKRLGFIEDEGGLKINNSLLSVVLHE